MTRPYERAHRRFPRDAVSRIAAAALGDAVPAARVFSVRAALSVLLHDDDLVQAGRGADEPGSQSLLDPQPDFRAFREAALPHLLPGMDVEHHRRLGRLDFRLARGERVRRLRDRAAALPRRERHRHGDLSRLPRATLDPVHPARHRRVPDRDLRHALGADPHLSHVPDPVLHLAPDGVFPYYSLRAGGMRADRRRHALADSRQDHPAAGRARADLGRDLRLHALLERVHLRAHVRLLVRGEDGSGGSGHRARRRRRLPLGRADGGRAARLPAGGGPVFLLRRVLRVGHDGSGEGVNRLDFKDRAAIVTGGLQGIGAAIAKRLEASGAEVIVWDIAAKTGAVDVSDAAAVERATAKAFAGLGRIDALVNNAGVAGLNAPTVEYPVEEWERVLKTNLSSQFLCCRAVAPHMVKGKYGRIVNIASIAGKEGNPNAAAYSASKAGVIALTKSLGKELAQTGVLVNCVTPAAAKTAIFDQMTQEHIDYMLSKIPMNRFVEVDEIAALACWLASEDCSFSTGAVFDISGGRAAFC